MTASTAKKPKADIFPLGKAGLLQAYRTMRTIRQGEMVSTADINAKSFIEPPKGTVTSP